MEVSRQLLFCALLVSGVALSQVTGQDPKVADKPRQLRILITEGDSWEKAKGHPGTDEMVKTFNRKCPELMVTNDYSKEADYVVRLELDVSNDEEILPEATKFVLFSQDGRQIYTSSKKPTLDDAIKGVCSAIQKAAKHDGSESPSEGITLDDMEH